MLRFLKNRTIDGKMLSSWVEGPNLSWEHWDAAVQNGSVTLSTLFGKHIFAFFLHKSKTSEHLHEFWNNKGIFALKVAWTRSLKLK